MDMVMTHYMELLATNQPWNLLIFMAIPVALAEFIAISEFYILLNPQGEKSLHRMNARAGIVLGVYFVGVFLYLFFTAVVPLTQSGGWRGPADVIAVGFYLLGVVPLFALALMGLGLLGKNRSEHGKLWLHATFVALFLVVAHVAMIFGMLNPTILGYHNMVM